MKNVLWLSNHPVNQDQKAEIKNLFGVDTLVTELGPEGKTMWSSVPPDGDFFDVECLWWDALKTVHTGNLSDFSAVVVMGELSLCLAVVAACVASGVSVFTPTTSRKSEEQQQPDGSVRKVNVFKHCQLRCLHKNH